MPVRRRRNRLRQFYDDGNRSEQGKAHDQRQSDPDTTRLRLLVSGELVGKDRDENEVIDPEDHLHHDQSRKGNPSSGVRGETIIESMILSVEA